MYTRRSEDNLFVLDRVSHWPGISVCRPVWLAHKPPGIFPSLSAISPFARITGVLCISGFLQECCIQTQVLMLARQALSQPSQFPSC